MAKVWNSIAELDPLYLFTHLQYLDIVSNLIWVKISPLLDYLESLYGPVLQFDNGTPIDQWQSQKQRWGDITIETDARFKAANFRYADTISENVRGSLVWESLKKLGVTKEPNLKKATLSIQVPKNSAHSFWKSGSYSWKVDDDFYQFTVTRFGSSLGDANWAAARFAIEILRCTRAGVLPTLPTRRRPNHHCATLDLGRQLHRFWENGSKSFKNFSVDPEFWETATSKLDSMITVFPEFASLLKYYKVTIPIFRLGTSSNHLLKHRRFLYCGWDMLMRHANCFTK